MSEPESTTPQSTARRPDAAAPVVVRDRRKAWVVAAWIIAGLAIYVLQYELLIFGKPLCAGYLLTATIAMLLMVRHQGVTGRAAAMAVAIVGLFLYGSHLARQVRFHVLKSGYQAIVQEAEGGLTEAQRIELRRSGFLVDNGTPVRVAFPWIGIADNWCGVVFDPTDELSRFCGGAGQHASGFLRDPDLRRLFGGDMVRCERLENGWYFCWFT